MTSKELLDLLQSGWTMYWPVVGPFVIAPDGYASNVNVRVARALLRRGLIAKAPHDCKVILASPEQRV